MTFDMQVAREICIKLGLRYPARDLIDNNYQCALAAEMLPAVLDRIAELESALIEERAKTTEIFWHPGIDMTDIEEMKLNEARKQLHAEGKL